MLPKRLNECADHSEPGELSPSDVFAAKSSFGCSALGFGDAAGAAAAGSGSVGAVAAAGCVSRRCPARRPRAGCARSGTCAALPYPWLGVACAAFHPPPAMPVTLFAAEAIAPLVGTPPCAPITPCIAPYERALPMAPGAEGSGGGIGRAVR